MIPESNNRNPDPYQSPFTYLIKELERLDRKYGIRRYPMTGKSFFGVPNKIVLISIVYLN